MANFEVQNGNPNNKDHAYRLLRKCVGCEQSLSILGIFEGSMHLQVLNETGVISMKGGGRE